VSTDAFDPTPSAQDPTPATRDRVDAGPLGLLPRLARRQVRLEERLARLVRGPGRGGLPPLAWLAERLGPSVSVSQPELLWRTSGLLRPGLVAQFAWPGRRSRLGLLIDTPLAHAIVDRLLGFERTDAESRRQLTPVEWGILTFVLARTLDDLKGEDDRRGLGDLVLDRVGPERFGTSDLGAVVTLRWMVRLGAVTGALRLWIPVVVLSGWLEEAPVPAGSQSGAWLDRVMQHLDELAAHWRALAGTVAMPRGLGGLRKGGVLPIDARALLGTPQSPQGTIRLVLELAEGGSRLWFAAEPVPQTGGGRLRITRALERASIPREAVSMSSADEFPPPSMDAGLAPTEIPVTLTVELGRVNLTLARLADLQPGDVIELGRHSREPVELTSGGRLVARGELVQIDTELGVRVTNVFL
jgi:type III secretion system YscQ/HrcQ family protein